MNTLPPNVEGSPYLNDEFKRGAVYMNEEKPYAAYMRYNAYQDEMQVQGPDGISTLFKREYVWAMLEGEKFKIETYDTGNGTRQGYFVELNAGKTRLLKRYQSLFREGEKAVSSYSQDKPPRFEAETSYYLAMEGKPAQEVKLRKKDILEMLDNDASEGFVKENKLKLKDEAEVLMLLQHYNAQ
ncbi:hypothetical protein OZ410_06650 [Robiginitalea sp. M366]|uniref:hypothetical protein n=1 Tax=Robiginitalea aestuariiviva TaxID=3036903 RepID=UPI00240E869D|nr:hypothetical protein [Robiginitalea aestuariiviva]MDG1571989.1 hypothetical protein [Robiginitalea aestuariiviva]